MQTVKAVAYSLLSRRSYFSKQLKTKLLQKGFREEEIDPVLLELEAQGYLNDREQGERLIRRERGRGYGPLIIAQKLRERGGTVSLPIQVSKEDLIPLIKKKYAKRLPQEKNKVIAALLRRGYSFDLINMALRDIGREYEATEPFPSYSEAITEGSQYE